MLISLLSPQHGVVILTGVCVVCVEREVTVSLHNAQVITHLEEVFSLAHVILKGILET